MRKENISIFSFRYDDESRRVRFITVNEIYEAWEDLLTYILQSEFGSVLLMLWNEKCYPDTFKIMLLRQKIHDRYHSDIYDEALMIGLG